MRFHRLSLSILAHLFFILAVGMFLVDAVMIMAARKLVVESEISRCDLMITAVSRQYQNSLARTEGAERREIPAPDFDRLFYAAELFAMRIVDSEGTAVYVAGSRDAVVAPEIERAAALALDTGMKQSRLAGSTWGVFRNQQQYALISAPITRMGESLGAVAVVLDMGELYARLRQTQGFTAGYIFINLVLLGSYGLYQIDRLAVRPLKKLLRQVESFQEDDDYFPFGERAENEFGQISRALGQMLRRISDGKRELRATVDSLRRTNEELKRAQNDVINAEKLASVGRLAAGVAHEIGNPIAIVMGYLELIKGAEIDPADRNDIIERTGREIERIHTIIRKLLDFSRPSVGEKRRFSIHEVVEEVLAVMQFQPFMKDITARLDLRAAHADVHADPAQLRQVLVNLILNAADAIKEAMPEMATAGKEGEIVITTAETESDGAPMIRVSVADNGVGIPEEQRRQVFDPFFTTKSPGEGTGLGLSVCFTIIESFGGHIHANASPAGGTEMVIDLPLSHITMKNAVTKRPDDLQQSPTAPNDPRDEEDFGNGT